MARRVLEHITPKDWDSQKPGNNGFPRVRYLQQIDDTLNRPLLNRVTVSTNATAVSANGSVQSSGVGTGTIQPKRYAELTVKARVTFNVNSVSGPAFIYVYRTTGAVPANGSAPGGGDVAVGGDAFIGGPVSSGVNQSGAFSFIDTGLDPTKKYRFYLAIKAPNGTTLNLVNASQLFILERS